MEEEIDENIKDETRQDSSDETGVPVISSPPISHAAGVLFVDRDKRALLMRRTDGKGWAFPGGGIENIETAEQAARREVFEESGFRYDGPLTLWTRRIKDGVDFSTFYAETDKFPVTLNSEHDKATWIQPDTAIELLDLHPGVAVALLKSEMDDLAIARAMISGELVSPQRYGNVLLIALRITGVGASYRTAISEFVWRDPSLYLNDEFIQRCNGLPVIVEHPEGEDEDGNKTFPLLTTEEFKDRICGTIFVPYIDEVLKEPWGIAKIWDEGVANLLEKKQISTSPGVGFVPRDEGSKYKMEDGNHLLVEGKPTIIDHLALCGLGTWDRGGQPAGVDSVTAQADSSDDKLAAALAILRAAEINALCRRLQ
jgi:8-oxo-dGTP pyrophosphatase MutT (NUDIX family)